jgi:hypothetical protein
MTDQNEARPLGVWLHFVRVNPTRHRFASLELQPAKSSVHLTKGAFPEDTLIPTLGCSSMSKHPIARIVPILPVSDLSRAMTYYRGLGFSAEPYEDGDGYAFSRVD